MSDDASVVDLDTMSVRIIKALDDHGGSATTSELRNILGHEHTSHLHHRKVEYLEPHHLIDIHQPQDDSPGPSPPQEWSLTDNGLEILEEIKTDDGDQRDRLRAVGPERSARGRAGLPGGGIAMSLGVEPKASLGAAMDVRFGASVEEFLRGVCQGLDGDSVEVVDRSTED